MQFLRSIHFQVWDGIGNSRSVLLMYVVSFCGPKNTSTITSKYVNILFFLCTQLFMEPRQSACWITSLPRWCNWEIGSTLRMALTCAYMGHQSYCYHIYSSQATIFYFSDTVHFSARSLTYEMLRWAVLMDHYFVSGLLYSPMSGLSIRTLKFED